MARRVGVVGAGLAGLSLSTRLTEAGYQVELFDKGRGVGGRMSTRRADASTFDHGAQFFTVRDDRFRAFLERPLLKETWAVWDARFGLLKDGAVSEESPPAPRLVGVPGMNALARALAAPLNVQTGARVMRIQGEPGRWSLVTEDGGHAGPFDWVVTSAPPPQSAALLQDLTPLASRVASVAMEPCFALMVEPKQAQSLPFDGIRAEHPCLGWLANNRSKPGRSARASLVIQSNHTWASANVNLPLAEVGQILKEATSEIFGLDLSEPVFESTHRWLLARPAVPLGEPCLVDADARLAAFGDWCLAAKVEGAFLSALGLFEALSGSAW